MRYEKLSKVCEFVVHAKVCGLKIGTGRCAVIIKQP